MYQQDTSSLPLNKQRIIIKNIAFFTGISFLIYFTVVLPTNPESLTQYNWLNQGLIEIKINLINFFTSNGGNGGTGGTGSVVEDVISRTTSNASTITPTLKNVGVQTNLDGTSVSRVIQSYAVLGDAAGPDNMNAVTTAVNNSIKTITD